MFIASCTRTVDGGNSRYEYCGVEHLLAVREIDLVRIPTQHLCVARGETHIVLQLNRILVHEQWLRLPLLQYKKLPFLFTVLSLPQVFPSDWHEHTV